MQPYRANCRKSVVSNLRTQFTQGRFVGKYLLALYFIPVIQQKTFAARRFWVRRYMALVVSVPIPLRTQRAEAPARRKAFLLNYGNKKVPVNTCSLDLSTLDIYLCSVVKYWGYEKGKRKHFNMKAKIRIARLLQYLLFFIPVKKTRIMFYANKPLFYGAIAVVCVPVAGGTAWILFRRKKKVLKK